MCEAGAKPAPSYLELGQQLAAAERRAEEAEAAKNTALRRAWSAEAAHAQKVGMRREFEALLGVGDTTGEATFEEGLARLKRALAAEARAARLREALENISEETVDYTARSIADAALAEVGR